MSMTKLKIGIVCYPSIGGSGVVATNLGLELAKLGHLVHFISYEEPFRLIKKHRGVYFHKVDINEYSLFKYPDYTLPLAVCIEEVQRKYKLDILHVHYAVPHATAALLAKRIMRQNGIEAPKIITTLHGTDITLLAKDPSLFAIIKYSVERSNGVTAVSQSLKNDTIKVLKTDKPIEVIYNFYTPSKISVPREKIREKLGIKNSDFLAIHLSNLRPVKRIPDLLKIVAKMSAKGGSAFGGKKFPKFKLLILAGGDFKNYEPLVKKLGIQNSLIVKQNVNDIKNYLNAADAGIYTSETESFGMGILETMSYGSPILTTRVGGIPEVVNEGKTGFLLKLGDITGFVSKIKLLMQNEDLRKQMGSEAKKIACKKFCSQTVVKKYLEYYRQIM